MIFVCHECMRRFDMHDDTDEKEWHYGHDCEAGAVHHEDE